MRMAICMITTARTVAPIAIQAHPLISFSLSGMRTLGRATLYRKMRPPGTSRPLPSGIVAAWGNCNAASPNGGRN